MKEKKIELLFYKLNDFSAKKFGQVDDKGFWMTGQVISPEPLHKAIEHIFSQLWSKVPVIYFSPSGDLMTQKKVEEYYQEFSSFEDCIIICGHYEGIDQRIIELYVTQEICVGEYVLTSGELASMVFLDAYIRHIPGVLWNPESLACDSFSEKFSRKKEYPVYTRPRDFLGEEVPEVLVSGDHKKIHQWKMDSLR